MDKVYVTELIIDGKSVYKRESSQSKDLQIELKQYITDIKGIIWCKNDL